MADIKINLGAIPSPDAAKEQNAPVQPAQAPFPLATPGGVNIFSPSAMATAKSGENTIMLQSIVEGKAEAAAKLKPILGNAAAMQKTLEQEKEYRTRKKLRLMQFVFTGVFVLSALTFFYFYSELSPSFNFFGPNTTARLSDVNKNLTGLQTEINKYRYLAAQQDLNEFSFLVDQFMDKTSRVADPTTPSTMQTQLSADVTELKNSMPTVLTRIKSNLGQDIVIKTLRSESEPELTDDLMLQQFESALRDSLLKYKTEIGQGQENVQDIRMVDNAINLVSNKALIASIKGVSIDKFKKDMDDYVAAPGDAVKRKNLQTLFSSILSSTKSDIATISAIKNARINWSTVISQIEKVTAGTDLNFNTPKASIIYSGYEFDTLTNKVMLSGVTKTENADNFTIMSTLIDNLEGSPYFQDVEMRSFSKSASDFGYQANFKIDLSLETNGTSPQDKTISLDRKALFDRIKYKRIGASSNNADATKTIINQ
jgi:hypothetical protein